MSNGYLILALMCVLMLGCVSVKPEPNDGCYCIQECE